MSSIEEFVAMLDQITEPCDLITLNPNIYNTFRIIHAKRNRRRRRAIRMMRKRTRGWA